MVRRGNTPTRKDVAKLAGVSETVVSYVLNNNRYVAKEKRERVLDAVEQLNYRPNNVALAGGGPRLPHLPDGQPQRRELRFPGVQPGL